MEVKKEEIRYILQYHYNQREKAEQAAKKVCAVYGLNIVSNATAKRWFQRFRSGNMDVEDETRSGRPIVENVDKIMEIVESDRHASTYSIAQELKISQKTVWNHLHKAGLKKKLDVWVPHELTQKNLLDRIHACDSLLKRNEIDPFFKRMVTGDEKWVTYENNRRKRSWSKRGEPVQTIAKPGLTANKILLCVW
ncbi:histone-lysine N-methyltransferase SETMAR-like [Harpegnathos saltator]|uniref:histone-lysine N-methyltransferase SETMAR-like n=1 Tax=Harpegnathos saltator TaxID=610380 RepID=UPI000DBEE05C|nr:histone-lysine N-methyltransferase SETMAR-like [Harpegnathos saltator]XP_025161761.1 histone-lysine N-methyltransferase SETMAR-like [Harpegnathos saltator]